LLHCKYNSIGKAEEANKKIRWRNIKIQTTNLQPTPLDPTFVVNLMPNHVSEQEKMQGVHLLFDGKKMHTRYATISYQ